MARAYAPFVLHCWRLGAAERRSTVGHIQSGEQAVFPSVAAAVEWVCARDGEVPRHVPHEQARPSLTGDQLRWGGRVLDAHDPTDRGDT